MRTDIGDGAERAVLADDGHALAAGMDRCRVALGKIGESAEEDEAIAVHGSRPVLPGFLQGGGQVQSGHGERHQPQEDEKAPLHGRIAHEACGEVEDDQGIRRVHRHVEALPGRWGPRVEEMVPRGEGHHSEDGQRPHPEKREGNAGDLLARQHLEDIRGLPAVAVVHDHGGVGNGEDPGGHPQVARL